ncbi:hypothetical protein Fmac_021017 [Flemingia macrophylla]|uniref:Uncharacterized protein n=1 Tax=Flemingia macrophylla TaxID=520843 RepID=A0ABD1LXD8_9FABA
MSILRLMLQTPIADHHSSKLDALVNLVTQLAANQKRASVSRVCGIRSSNDHYTSVYPSSQQSGVDEHAEAYAANTYSIPPQGVHDVATDTSTETRKLEGKLYALVNLVTQLAANQKPAFVARICGIRSPMTTILVSVILRSNLEWMTILRLMLQTPIADHHSSRDKALDREDGSQLLALEGKIDAHVNLVTQLAANQRPASVTRVCGIRSSNDHRTSFSARNDTIVIRGVHDVATDTSAETRKQEGKLDALVNLVTQLAANQKPTSIARVCGIRSSSDHHTSTTTAAETRHLIEKMTPKSWQFSAKNDAIVIRGVHDMAIDTSTETRKLEGKIDAHVNLVTQLAANQRPASVTKVCGIRSSNDHRTSARNDAIVIRGVHDVATDTSAETRKLEGKLDALVNLVTQLATNQKSASVARVCDIRSLNDHHTSVCPSSQQSGQYSARNDAIVIRGVHDVATDTSAETKKLEGKLDSFVNLFSVRNDAIVIRGVHDVATDTSAETRKLEGKLDALVNLVTQLAANQKPTSIARVCGIRCSNQHSRRDKALDREDGSQLLATTTQERDKAFDREDGSQLLAPASVARVYGIRSSNDHHTSVCPSSQQSGVDEHPEAYSANTYSRPEQGVHDVATDTSAETRKLEDKLDALVNLVTQLAANQKSASIARGCDIRFSNDHHTSVCPSSQQSERMSILRLMLQTPIADHHSSRDKALHREDGSQLLAVQCDDESTHNADFKRRVLLWQARFSYEMGDSASYESKPASVARVCGIRSSNEHHTSTTTAVETRHLIEKKAPNSYQFSARNDAIVIRGVHDVATDTSAETRKLEGKLDALLNLVTQLAANQKVASIARVCGIRYYNDHHTSVCPSSQQSRVDEHIEAYAANTYSRPPQHKRQGT